MLESMRTESLMRLKDTLINQLTSETKRALLLPEEGDVLDYKSVTEKHNDVLLTNDLPKELKRIYSDYVGAFANSSGGIICWGIREPSKESKEFAPFTGYKNLCERLNEEALRVVVPPVQGILNIPVQDSDSPESGYVVTLIPASPWRPHQSESSHNYRLRTGSSTAPIPHYILMDMFAAKRRPDLEVSVSEVKSRIGRFGEFFQGYSDAAGPPGPVKDKRWFTVTIFLSLVNHSNSIAEKVSIGLETATGTLKKGSRYVDNQLDGELSVLTDTVSVPMTLFPIRSEVHVYPGLQIPLGSIAWEFSTESTPPDGLPVKWTAFADGFRKDGEILVPWATIPLNRES